MPSLLDVSKEEVVLKGKITEIEVVPFEKAFKNPEKALSHARDPQKAKERKYAKTFL
jgi:hypothetical protein